MLNAFSRYVARMGGPGAGMAAKIARNTIVMGAIRAGYEGSLLAKAAGADVRQFVQVMKDSVDAITGPTAITRRPDPLNNPGEAQIRNTMRKFMLKDIEAGLELAETLGVDLPVLRLTRETLDETVAFRQKDV